jgi:hypothetical protein
MIDLCEIYLSSNFKHIKQSKSAYIQCTAKKLYKAVSNPTLMIKLCPTIGDSFSWLVILILGL